MLKVLRFFFRSVVFLVALAAIVAIVGTLIWYFQTQGQGDITIALNDVPGGGEPEGVEDWLLGMYLQANADQINSPASDDSAPIPFTIESGETAIGIATRLQELGLIKDMALFRRFLQYHGLDASLEAGEYQLRRNMTMREVAEALQHSRVQEVTITIPEGWRAEQVADLLTAENIMDGSMFLAAVRQGVAIEHPLLTDRPPGAGFEGYLFPETYRLPLDATPEDLLLRMLDTMQDRLPISWEGMASAQDLTFYQVLTVASIVEREAVVPEERPTIASVYVPERQFPLQYLPVSGSAPGSHMWCRVRLHLGRLAAGSDSLPVLRGPWRRGPCLCGDAGRARGQRPDLHGPGVGGSRK